MLLKVVNDKPQTVGHLPPSLCGISSTLDRQIPTTNPKITTKDPQIPTSLKPLPHTLKSNKPQTMSKAKK